ncbi:MAG: hypothetical protein H6631_06235 [Anaerolineaceae bacterium]|nr:hypothetical protein [Anaerolineaceae bacterium]
MHPDTPDLVTLLQLHLQDKSTGELIALLIELVQQVDEPTRQQFLDQLAPPEPETVDLRSPSPEIFLSQLAAFAEAVPQGDYFDKEAQDYFEEPPAWRASRTYKYKPEDHAGLNALRHFLTEANAYFQNEQYVVAAAAYQTLLALTLAGHPYRTLGVRHPFRELGQDADAIVNRYLMALQQSRPAADFYETALNFLAPLDHPDRPYLDDFVALLDPNQQAEVCARLETWADELDGQERQTFPTGLPMQLRLLIRLYTVQGRVDQAVAVQHRFRQRYTMLYESLLAHYEMAQAWPAVISYGQEALAVLPPQRHPNFMAPRDGMDPTVVRTQMARAYEALGEPQQAFDIYEPVFDNLFDYETYATAYRLAGLASAEQAQELRRRVFIKLRRDLPSSGYMFCQVYLGEGQFEYIERLLDSMNNYYYLEALELLGSMYLLTAFGSEAKPKMGPRLQALYGKMAESAEEPFRFLRDHLPAKPDITRSQAIKHADFIYQQIMEIHIRNGRKHYATAAYYCALMGEIAAFGGRRAKFEKFYQLLLRRYSTYRALKEELAIEVERKKL